MSQTTFSVRMDSEIKQQLDDFCHQVGMNTSTAINMFARAVLRERRLPFEVASAGEQTAYDMSELIRRKNDMDKGLNVVERDIVEVVDEATVA